MSDGQLHDEMRLDLTDPLIHLCHLDLEFVVTHGPQALHDQVRTLGTGVVHEQAAERSDPHVLQIAERLFISERTVLT